MHIKGSNKKISAVRLYLQDPVDVVQRVLGAQRGLVGVFDQGDVSLFLRVLDAAQPLGHREEISRHLAGVHQQDCPAGKRRTTEQGTVRTLSHGGG